ncbi:nuclear transport factor 2 family protein [Listeria sp. FSL L7-1485]|uniref:Nuclear transport factor 2 family protein n=1 Tax=Listeria immobilis TaxID=2713502 RepID=A0A7X0X867_9LIST|nr:nuclear transport factor 2 family protein [Listeria immobilis]MBC1489405.1 nuclear transport factor 2 family protein [Listeria immobilis]MBC1535106.1 nuclear transport factor 2 family protein [Listeria immobilis]
MNNAMSIEEKRAIPHQFHTNLNNRDFQKQYDLITSDIKFYKNGEVIEGADNFIVALQGIALFSEDAHIEDQEIYADDNVAVCRYTLSGTLTGDITFPTGARASKTGKKFSYGSVEFFEFNDEGKVYEIRQINDSGLTPTTIESQVK